MNIRLKFYCLIPNWNKLRLFENFLWFLKVFFFFFLDIYYKEKFWLSLEFMRFNYFNFWIFFLYESDFTLKEDTLKKTSLKNIFQTKSVVLTKNYNYQKKDWIWDRPSFIKTKKNLMWREHHFFWELVTKSYIFTFWILKRNSGLGNCLACKRFGGSNPVSAECSNVHLLFCLIQKVIFW